MKKLFLTFCLFFCASLVFAQGVPHPATPRIMIDSDGTLLDSANPLPVDAQVTIGSITIEAFPVYADSVGNPATATVDAENRAVVSIDSETIGLVDAVEQPTDFQQQIVTLVAGTAQNVTTKISGRRKYIILKAQDSSKEFWVSIDGAAVAETNGMLVNDWVKIDAPETVTVSVVSSEAQKISVIEGGN